MARTRLSPDRKEIGPGSARAGIYLRVSTAEQVEGHSLGSQLAACRDYVERRGWQLGEVFEDAGLSATSTARPAFQRMLAAAEAGELDAIVVLKFDRFARSLEDWIVTRRALQRRGVELLSVTEPIEDNPMAPILEALHGGLAEWYSRDLSAKVTRGKRARAEKGLLNGMAPFGFAPSLDAAHVPPQIVPAEAAAVRECFERFATGVVSMVTLARDLNAAGHRTRYRARRGSGEAGGRRWSSASISAMLANATYAGFVTHKAERLPGRHEAIVPLELFQQVERVRSAARGRPAAPQRDLYLLRGIARCSRCLHALQGNHTPSGSRWRYYRETAVRRGIQCSAPQGSVRADWLEGEIDALVARLRMPSDVRERVLALLQDETADPEVERAQLLERQRRLALLYADLEIQEGDYQARRRALDAELARLTVPVQQAAAAAATFDVLRAAWSRATPQEKRGLTLALFEAVYVDMATKTIAEVVVQPSFRPWLIETNAATD